MTRGEGFTSNKFRKYIGTQCLILEVGTAPHQYTVEMLETDPPDGWVPEEIAEIVSAYLPQAKPTVVEQEEVQIAVEPNAKRGPGRPRKVSSEVDTTREVHPQGLE